MSLKREIAQLVGEKGLEDLDCTTDVYVVGIYSLKSLPERACRLKCA